MKFTVTREQVLEPLQWVTGVVERRQTQPILANLLVEAESGQLRLTGTDQEVELVVCIDDCPTDQGDPFTIPARKFLDICRSLPESAKIRVEPEDGRLLLSSGRFKSHLANLPAEDFPRVGLEKDLTRFEVAARDLAQLLDRCSFAMAQQDVRYFFNGMLLELDAGRIRAVATNGQRLATSFIDTEIAVSGKRQVIIPRKGIAELGRLLSADRQMVSVELTDNHFRASSGSAVMTTRLIDATYPDYSRAIPKGGDRVLTADRVELREALTRTAILSNEMYRNVKLRLGIGSLAIEANNPLQEEAEETVTVDYDGDELEIGFNVGYLLDVLGAVSGDRIRMQFTDSGGAVLIKDVEDDRSLYVVSPMIL